MGYCPHNNLNLKSNKLAFPTNHRALLKENRFSLGWRAELKTVGFLKPNIHYLTFLIPHSFLEYLDWQNIVIPSIPSLAPCCFQAHIFMRDVSGNSVIVISVGAARAKPNITEIQQATPLWWNCLLAVDNKAAGDSRSCATSTSCKAAHTWSTVILHGFELFVLPSLLCRHIWGSALSSPQGAQWWRKPKSDTWHQESPFSQFPSPGSPL